MTFIEIVLVLIKNQESEIKIKNPSKSKQLPRGEWLALFPSFS